MSLQQLDKARHDLSGVWLTNKSQHAIRFWLLAFLASKCFVFGAKKRLK
jgi:hypothetical protein